MNRWWITMIGDIHDGEVVFCSEPVAGAVGRLHLDSTTTPGRYGPLLPPPDLSLIEDPLAVVRFVSREPFGEAVTDLVGLGASMLWGAVAEGSVADLDVETEALDYHAWRIGALDSRSFLGQAGLTYHRIGAVSLLAGTAQDVDPEAAESHHVALAVCVAARGGRVRWE